MLLEEHKQIPSTCPHASGLAPFFTQNGVYWRMVFGRWTLRNIHYRMVCTILYHDVPK